MIETGKTRRIIVSLIVSIAMVLTSFASIAPIYAETAETDQPAVAEEQQIAEDEPVVEEEQNAEEEQDEQNAEEPLVPQNKLNKAPTEGTEETDPAHVAATAVTAPTVSDIKYNYLKNTSTIKWSKASLEGEGVVPADYKITYTVTWTYKGVTKNIKSNTTATSMTFKTPLDPGKHTFQVIVKATPVATDVWEENKPEALTTESEKKNFVQEYITEGIRGYSWYTYAKSGCTLYRFRSGGASKGKLKKGTKVAVYHKTPSSIKWYEVPSRVFIKQFNKKGKVVKKGWVKWSKVKTPITAKTSVLKKKGYHRDWAPEVLENYVNKKGYSSKKYLLFASRYTQKVYIFKGGKKHWKLYKTFRIETGKFTNPTKTGKFQIRSHKTKVVSHRSASGAGYYFRNASYFYGKNSFHSISWRVGSTTKVVKPMGKKAQPSTRGCVRMDLKNATWIYKNVPTGATVIVK